jgi:hypothetical protein
LRLSTWLIFIKFTSLSYFLITYHVPQYWWSLWKLFKREEQNVHLFGVIFLQNHAMSILSFWHHKWWITDRHIKFTMVIGLKFYMFDENYQVDNMELQSYNCHFIYWKSVLAKILHSDRSLYYVIMVFSIVTLHSDVVGYQCFRRPCCLHLQGEGLPPHRGFWCEIWGFYIDKGLCYRLVGLVMW